MTPDGAHQWWSTAQRMVVLTFVDGQAAERFDKLAALAGDREALIRVATGGAAEVDIVFDFDDVDA